MSVSIMEQFSLTWLKNIQYRGTRGFFVIHRVTLSKTMLRIAPTVNVAQFLLHEQPALNVGEPAVAKINNPGL